MRLFTTIAVAALALSTLPAKAADPFLGDTTTPQRSTKFYAALRGGFTMPEDAGPDGILGDLDDTSLSDEYEDFGVFASAAAGVAFSALRLEAEAGYFHANADEHSDGAPVLGLGGLDVYTVLANAYYDIDLGRIVPFIGAGAGVGFIDSDGPIDPDAAFAYQLTLGLGFDLTDNVATELGYRFQHLRTDASLPQGDADLDIETHIGYVGIRAKF